MKDNKLVWKRFTLIALVVHIPIIAALLGIPGTMLPALYWINIPVLWTGIASAMGESHFLIREFGAAPQSELAYVVVIAFWLVLSLAISFVSVRLSEKT